jgi:hypothetical protein
MGIVNIDDALHEEVRKAGRIMCRSINAQAEFWMKIGMIAESNPTTKSCSSSLPKRALIPKTTCERYSGEV